MDNCATGTNIKRWIQLSYDTLCYRELIDQWKYNNIYQKPKRILVFLAKISGASYHMIHMKTLEKVISFNKKENNRNLLNFHFPSFLLFFYLGH